MRVEALKIQAQDNIRSPRTIHSSPIINHSSPEKFSLGNWDRFWRYL